MGLQNITESRRVELVSFSLYYAMVGNKNCGYAFNCDENGVLEPLSPTAQNSFELAQDKANYQVPVIQRYVNRYFEHATGKCQCGETVRLDDPLSNDCACGRCYNMSGQEVQAHYGRAECEADGCAWDEEGY